MFNTLTRMGASGAGAYEIERSLRFKGVKGGSYPQLDRTIQSGGNPEKWTFAVWFKTSQIGTVSGNSSRHFLGPFRGGDGSNESVMRLDSSDRFQIYDSGGTQLNLITHRRFRDMAAWMHLVVAVDTTQGTAANRVKIYFNGVQETEFSTSTYPSQDYDLGWNKNQMHSIGRYAYPDASSGANVRFGGYMADLYFIDDQQLTPTSFGETSITTGEFVPIKYTGTYGTTGFYLDFSDNSSVSALGTDRSGNSNDWAPDNISVASNNTSDSVLDTPTNNYATLNGICGRDGYFAEFSDANLHTHLVNGSYYQFAVATQGITSGKYYWEVTVDDAAASGDATRAVISLFDMDTSDQNGFPDYNGRFYFKDGEKKVTDDGSGSKVSYGDSFDDGDVIGVALDMSAGTLTMYKNGSTQGVLDNTMLSKCPDSGWFPGCYGYSSSNFTFNFGQQPFTHTPPTGHVHLCTANAPTPIIKDPSKHFNTVLYTGNGGSSQTITGLDFSPDFVWFKERSGTQNHMVFDTVRGVEESLWPNDTWEEEAYSGEGVSAFNSNGVTIGDSGNLNVNNDTYVMWAWKESATAGFDIVSYTGNGSGPRTISHNLGVKPELIICKNRDQATNWMTYHEAIGAEKFLYVNTDAIQMDDSAAWNDTEPTSSVFTVNADQMNNGDGDDIIAYCFASVNGFSKVGSYEGTGDAEGPYIYTGFRPAYILTKRVETASNAYWNIFDTVRDPFNTGTTARYKRLLAHTNSAEATNHANYTPPEIFSNGFRFVHGRADTNYDDKKFVYIAFAESPFKYANAR